MSDLSAPPKPGWEEELDRVLTAFSETQAPPQLTETVLSNVRRRLAPASLSARSIAGRTLLKPAFAASVIALVGVVLALPVLRRASPVGDAQPGAALHQKASQAAFQQSTASDRVEPHGATGLHGSAKSGLEDTKWAGSASKLRRLPLMATTPAPVTTWSRLPTAELAAREDGAPSQPEPPLPVTSDERQIRRFVERHNAYELAALDALAEPAHERGEMDQFRRFFAPPPEPTGNLPLPPLDATASSALADPR